MAGVRCVDRNGMQRHMRESSASYLSGQGRSRKDDPPNVLKDTVNTIISPRFEMNPQPNLGVHQVDRVSGLDDTIIYSLK
jgi:hypothetical protein